MFEVHMHTTAGLHSDLDLHAWLSPPLVAPLLALEDVLLMFFRCQTCLSELYVSFKIHHDSNPQGMCARSSGNHLVTSGYEKLNAHSF